jgi:hypothetical protein
MRQFWCQPCRRYRDFQVVFTLLTLNFVVPAVSYALRPEIAAAQFAAINELLGGAPYTFPEAGSRLWRYLGAANVMTLGLLCLLLQLDLRRYRASLGILVFLKSYNATLFLFGFVAATQFPALLAVALFDYATSLAFWFFATRAHHEIADRPNADLVPAPRWTSA